MKCTDIFHFSFLSGCGVEQVGGVVCDDPAEPDPHWGRQAGHSGPDPPLGHVQPQKRTGEAAAHTHTLARTDVKPRWCLEAALPHVVMANMTWSEAAAWWVCSHHTRVYKEIPELHVPHVLCKHVTSIKDFALILLPAKSIVVFLEANKTFLFKGKNLKGDFASIFSQQLFSG